MTEQQLAAAIRRPEIHRSLVGNYRGPYALGVTREGGRPALSLRLEGQASAHVPSEIVIDGEVVPVIIHGGFQAPRAF